VFTGLIVERDGSELVRGQGGRFDAS
jgi:hypothetical protein